MPSHTPEEQLKRLQEDPTLATLGDVGRTPGGFVNLTTNQPITSDILTPIAIPNFQTPQPSPVFPIASLNTELPETKLTQPEKQADDLSTRLQALNERLLGQSAVRAQKEIELGVPELIKSQRDLSTRLKTLQAEALAIPLQIQQEFEGRGVTKGGAAPIEAGRLRQNAIQALSVGAMFEATKGNLQTAFDLVDRAVDQEFGPIREEIAIKTANLDLILKSPSFSLAEKNRAQTQKEAQEARALQIANQETNAKEIKNYAVEAAKKGAPTDILQKIQSARSPQEALQIAGFYLGANFREEVEAKQFQRALQETTFNLSLDKFNEDKRQFSANYALQQQEFELKKFNEAQKKNPVASAEVTAEILQGKVDLIDDLSKHPGLDSRVGPGVTTRGLFTIQDRFGAGQEFAAGVKLLVGRETIDTLINLKARGGTLGALSDKERELLEQSTTKIGSWEIKKNGEGTGRWNVTEKAFKAELDRIKDLAIRAKARALGGGIGEIPTKTEEDELRSAGYSEEQIRLLLEIK